MKTIAQTARLTLREFDAEADAPFVLRLLNSPGWLEFIGDRNVRTEADAAAYLANVYIPMYAKFGYGLWAVDRREDGLTIGSCGLLQRDFLDGPDIGFALLPGFDGQGYALEAAGAAMLFAKENLPPGPVHAFTDKDNHPSIGLLKKIGLRPQELFIYPNTGGELLLLSTGAEPTDQLEIDLAAAQFFALFSNKEFKKPRLQLLEKLCLPTALFTKKEGDRLETTDLPAFKAPRELLLNGGGLTDFVEKETSAETEIDADRARRWSFYEKSGVRDGQPFEQKGRKEFEFLKTGCGWKIAAVVWEDEN